MNLPRDFRIRVTAVDAAGKGGLVRCHDDDVRHLFGYFGSGAHCKTND